MEVFLGKTKVNATGRNLTTLMTSLPLAVQVNLHITLNQKIFFYFEEGRIYLETVERDESSFGINSNSCFLGSKALKKQGSVLYYSFTSIFRDILGLSRG